MSKTKDLAIVWFRNDLRVHDNPALQYALAQHTQVLCVFITDTLSDDPSAAQCWLVHALSDLDQQLGGQLTLISGDELAVLSRLKESTRATAVYWNRCYSPLEIRRDKYIKQSLKDRGVTVKSFIGSVIFEPWEILKKDGTPYKVFTPFYKACLQYGLRGSQAALPSDWLNRIASKVVSSDSAKAWLPTNNWARQLMQFWKPTRDGAVVCLDEFRQKNLAEYSAERDQLAKSGTSQLSPYLHFGQISPREIYAQFVDDSGADAFIRQLIWREFAVYVLYHWPDTLSQPMNPRFQYFPWRDNSADFKAWCYGQTGIPLVDAGMRELWQSGTMHNRARMITASFLTKHLRIDWRRGAEWFMYTLLDADLANNTMGWQWVAGCGVDAAPYFRVFNPVGQGERFDASGDYIRRWCPELSALPTKWIHKPWQAPLSELQRAQIVLGKNYPHPVIDLATGRQAALDAWEAIKSVPR